VSKATTKYAPIPHPRVTRKTPAKLDITKAVAPAHETVPMKRVTTAFAAGYLTATQEAKNILGRSRTVGEILDALNQHEALVSPKLLSLVQAELKAKRITIEGKAVRTANTEEGPVIIVAAIEHTPEVQQAIAAAEAAMLAEKATAPTASSRKRPPARKAA
jgi:hypothetical protein